MARFFGQERSGDFEPAFAGGDSRFDRPKDPRSRAAIYTLFQEERRERHVVLVINTNVNLLVTVDICCWPGWSTNRCRTTKSASATQEKVSFCCMIVGVRTECLKSPRQEFIKWRRDASNIVWRNAFQWRHESCMLYHTNSRYRHPASSFSRGTIRPAPLHSANVLPSPGPARSNPSRHPCYLSSAVLSVYQGLSERLHLIMSLLLYHLTRR